MRRKCSGASAVQAILLMTLLLGVAAFLLPVLLRDDGRPTGVVLDAARRPMPGAVLRFRDGSGNTVATLTADGHGQFRRHRLGALNRYAIDGYAVTHFIHSTGGSDHFYYSPLGTQQARFRDADGRPMSGLAVSFTPDQRTWLTESTPRSIGRSCDPQGVVRLPNIPLSARFDIASDDPRYVARDVQTQAGAFGVRYTVTAVPSSTISGRLLSPDGTPLGGCYAFVTNTPNTDLDERHYAQGVTGASGRFRITSLPPGTYYVSAKPPLDFHSIAPARRVTIGSGQTVETQLRARSELP